MYNHYCNIELLVIFHCAFFKIINNIQHAACDLLFSRPVHDASHAYALSTFDTGQTEQLRSPISSRLFQNYPHSKFAEIFFFGFLSVFEQSPVQALGLQSWTEKI